MANNKKSINSRDIALLAGVSRSTISKVINGYTDVSETTRARVHSIVEQYGYSPNIAGQQLAGKKTAVIGLFFIIQQNEPYSFADDTIADQMLAHVADTAADFDYLTLTTIIRKMDTDAENRIRTIFTQKRIDGGLFIGARETEPVIEELAGDGYPVAVLDYKQPRRQKPNMLIANYDPHVGAKSVDYLASRGYRKIMAVHGDQTRFDGCCKNRSFLEGLARNGLEQKDKWISYTDFNTYGSYRIVREYFLTYHEYPDAVFCANDHIAYGVISALKELQISVPADVAVIGVDDALPSRYCSPPVTTFRTDFPAILRPLTRGLINYIRKPGSEIHYTENESTLVERKSC